MMYVSVFMRMKNFFVKLVGRERLKCPFLDAVAGLAPLQGGFEKVADERKLDLGEHQVKS